MKLKVLLITAFVLGVLLTTLFFQKYQIDNYQIRAIPTLSFADGSTYAGDVNEAGLIDGAGHLQWTNGRYYKGEFKAGLIHGKGQLVFPNDITIEGDFADGLSHGKAKVQYQDGKYYQGDFIKAKMTGEGKWFVPDVYTYQGGVEGGVFKGQGEINYVDGNKYVGQFEHGEMHGEGTYETSDGDVYSGTFVKGSFSGKGVFKDSQGTSYKGSFKGWLPHGEGSKSDAKGNRWQGKFEGGQLSGEGHYSGVKGEQYTGSFLHGRYSGQGVLIEANGNTYKGGFDYGSKHGEGEITLSEAVDGISHYKGRWQYGTLVEGDENFKVFPNEDIAEFSLYNQVDLLEKALTKIAPQDPNKIDLYVMGVAGYGSEEVFRREVNFVEQKMHQLYGVGQRSLYLSNSRKSLDDRPLATVTSIEKSLLKIAEQMDKNQDILFLFITSHGSKDLTISLNQKGLSLADLTSTKLTQVLKQTGIKHKVIVLSACYSGGFINALKDEYTLVITAAAPDKRSFGCADDNIFTYFGEAYFKESLQPSLSFIAAFDNAKGLVKKWEKEQGSVHSEPQISSAPKIEQYLKKWRQQL